MPQYDFAATVQEELRQLSRELSNAGIEDTLHALAARFGVSEREMLAALWRTSKRHGETLTVFATELREQFERETAATGAGT